MRVLRNTGQNISPSDDGRLFDQAFTDGLFNSPSITSLGADKVQIGAMYGILCGRDFTSDAQQVSVALSDSGTKTGHIFIRFDTTTADIISIQSVIGSYTPTYQDINTTGTIAEMEIASYTATVLAVTAITPNYPKAQTEPNEAIAGSLAAIETSPATANHAVGTYIVYNGQLYRVTTAIVGGTTLNGKITPATVADTNIDITITYADPSVINTTYSWAIANPITRHVQGQIYYTAAVTGSLSAIANIPAPYRPSRQAWGFAAGSNGGGYVGRYTVTPGGDVNVAVTGTIPSDSGFAYGVFIPFSYYY